MADPATDAHSTKQANLILRGVGLAEPSTTGGLNQKPTDNHPLTAHWPHKKVWLTKTGHWAEYDDLSVEQFMQGYLEIVLLTIPIGPSTAVTRDHIGYLQNMMWDTSSSPWHLVRLYCCEPNNRILTISYSSYSCILTAVTGSC